MSIDKYLDRTVNDRYRIDKKLDGDSTGPLYKAYDEILQRLVVIKFVRLDVWSSIRSTVQKVARFDYPYLVDIFDFGSSGGERFVLLRHIHGDSLAAMLERGDFKQPNPLTPRILLSLAAVLDFLAKEGYSGVIPTPDHILVEPDGKAYLADYNLKWIVDAQQKGQPPNTAVTRPDRPTVDSVYFAPEVLMGAGPTARAGQYALGVIAAELLSGQSAQAAVLRGVNQPERGFEVGRLSNLKPESATAIRRATHPKLEERYDTAHGFVLDVLRNVHVDARITGEFNITPDAAMEASDDGLRSYAPPAPAPAPPPQTEEAPDKKVAPAAPLQPGRRGVRNEPDSKPAPPPPDDDRIAFGDEGGIGLGQPGTIGYGAPADLPPEAADKPPSTPDMREEVREEGVQDEEVPRTSGGPPPAPDRKPPSGAAPADDTTPVVFDAYYPRAARVDENVKFMVYALVDNARPAVKADVAQFAEQLGGTVPVPVSAADKPRLRTGTLVTVVLLSDDLAETPYLTRRWNGKWVRYEFELEPPASLAGQSLVVDVSIQVRGIEIARIAECVIFVGVGEDDPTPNPLAAAKFNERRTQPYHRIFVSYSRRDTPVVEAYRVAQIAMGNDVFMDTYSIRSGENWRAALARGIDSADIFQLFWSENSARSENVRDEWDYALSHRCAEDGCQTFIRPVFWETPIPDVPEPLAHLNFVYAKLIAQRPLLPWLMLAGIALLVFLVLVIAVVA